MSDVVPQELKGLKILHYAFLAGSCMIMLLLYFLIFEGDKSTVPFFDGDIISIFGVMIGLMNLALSFFLFQRDYDKHNFARLTDENIAAYRSSRILQYAFLEGACLVNTLFFFTITPQWINLILALVLWGVLWLNKP